MKLGFEIPDKLNRRKAFVWLAAWFGCGFIKPAPGTWGSLGALPFGVALLMLGGVNFLITGIIVITAIGLWSAHKFDTAMDGHDSKMIVIDEVAGQWIALIPCALNPILILIAFISFRFFDILKPYPISIIDKQVKGAAGVMGDDLVAGLFAAAIVILASIWF